MKHLSKSLVVICVTLTAVVLPLSVSFAANAPAVPTKVKGNAKKFPTINPTVIPTIVINFAEVKTKILAAFDAQIAKLQALPAQIDADTTLTEEQKTALKTKAQETLALLTDLRAKVLAAQTQEDLLKVLQDFLTQAMASGSDAQTVQSIQSLITGLKTQGADTSELQNALDQAAQDEQADEDAGNELQQQVGSVKNLGQAIQLLKQFKQKPVPGAHAMQNWTSMLHSLQNLKKKYGKLFPTYMPSVFPTKPANLTGNPTGAVTPKVTEPEVTEQPEVTEPVNPTSEPTVEVPTPTIEVPVQP